MHIQVRIDEQGALRNQRYAFTDRFTLVSELLQNARRACASRVDVLHYPSTQTLTVTDDGVGIGDFQQLLTLHQSGWAETTQQAERPFGVGFSKCLYAARRCIVRSRGQRVDFDTAAALAREPIAVLDDPQPVRVGTVVELHGVELPELEHRMQNLCMGFPIEVWFNGQTLDRPWAAQNLSMRRTAIGQVHLCGATDGRMGNDTVVFLQGLAVIRSVWASPGKVSVVHLDPQLFMARLPDRDRLIDEDIQRQTIDEVLRDTWREVLLEAKAALPAGTFIDRYYRVMRAWGQLDLLNDMDELPRWCFNEIVAYPQQSSDHKPDYVRTPDVAPTRREIQSRAITLVHLGCLDAENAARWLFVQGKHWLLFDLGSLHIDHWVHEHVRCIEDEVLSIEPVQARAGEVFHGRWISPEVVLCESVRMAIDGDTVDIRDVGVCVCDTLYMPQGEHTGGVVLQCSSYTDEEDQFQGEAFEADRDALADWLRRQRSVDPCDTLVSLIGELSLERYAVLHGHAFTLAVGNAASRHAVELIT